MLKEWLSRLFGKKDTPLPQKDSTKVSNEQNESHGIPETPVLQGQTEAHSSSRKDTSPKKQDNSNYSVRSSRRSSDMNAEHELSAFLDSYLYKPLLAEGRFTSIVRVTDVDMQLLGADVVATTETQIARIDENAQLYYINQDLPTFAFELQFLKGKQRCTGWFLNENLVTDYYLLIWPHAKTAKVSEIKKDDFTVLDALMISRHKIHSFLSRNGLNQDELLCTANSLREKGVTGKVPTKHRGIYYYASDPSKYAEAPINLVIRKTYLLSLADMHYRITNKGFDRLS